MKKFWKKSEKHGVYPKSARTRRLIKRAKGDYRILRKHALYPPKNLNKVIPHHLAQSDNHRKRGDLYGAHEILDLAYDALMYGTENKKYEADELKKYAQAISNRAGRIRYQVRNNPEYRFDSEAAQDSSQLLKALREEFGVTPHRSHWGIAIGVISFVFGLFFLSANITGNVIGKSTMGVSNFLGALFLIIGLIQIFFFVRKR